MSNLALPAPQPPNSAAFGPHGSAPGPWLGLSHTQKLALAAVAVCVAATAWAAITEVDLNEVRIPIAGISLLCAFMSPAALPDWRGKAAFVVFMLFTGFVVLKDDPTRDAAPRILESAGQDQAGSRSLRAERPRRGSEFSVAAAQL
ncbi:MAG TPA: hypothetical protein VF541_12845, partial [Longimicrobium sp.]